MNDFFTYSSSVSAHTKASAADIDTLGQAIETAFDLMPGKAELNEDRITWGGTDTGAADAYVVTANASNISAYTAGLRVRFIAANTNTGASTVNLNSIGVKAIKDASGDDIASGDIVAGQVIELTYDGTNFKFTSATVSAVAGAAASAAAAAASASAASTSASTASTHASTASTQASNAAASAAAASTDADDAAASAVAAAAELSAALKIANDLSDLNDVQTAQANINVDQIIIPFILYGGGSVLSTGEYPGVPVPVGCTITKYEVNCDQSGSMVVDIWSSSYADLPAADGDSITASAPVTVAAATKATDSTLTGWTKTIAQGDWLIPNIDSVTTITYCTVALFATRAAS